MQLLIQQMSPKSQYIYRVQKIGQMTFYTARHCPLRAQETHHMPMFIGSRTKAGIGKGKRSAQFQESTKYTLNVEHVLCKAFLR